MRVSLNPLQRRRLMCLSEAILTSTKSFFTAIIIDKAPDAEEQLTVQMF